MKKNLFALAGIAILMSSCGSQQFAITSTGENLSALTKVTDNEEPCISPFTISIRKIILFQMR